MKNTLIFLLLFPALSFAQKKPLDHTVYDEWQSVNERLISKDGKWIVYTILPQEGDGNLYVQPAGSGKKVEIPRGHQAVISEDSRFVLFEIKAPFSETREARIKKKKPEEMPKDSFGILDLSSQKIVTFDRVKSFKTPEKGFGWVVIQKEASPEKSKMASSKSLDSLKKKIDSLTILVNELKNIKGGSTDALLAKKSADSTSESKKGNALILYNLLKAEENEIADAGEFLFNKQGSRLAIHIKNVTSDSINNGVVILYNLNNLKADTILRAINEAKNFAFDEAGNQLAFLAESGADKKSEPKYFDLYHYVNGSQTASRVVDRNSRGMPGKYSVSENGNVKFSANGRRLFFGTAPIPAPKDTTLVEIDLVKLDIWNYKDDYLQTQQLSRLKNDQKANFLAVYHIEAKKMIQLGSEGLPTVLSSAEGNAEYFVATTDTGRRVASQWTGSTFKDVYTVNVNTGERHLVKQNLDGTVFPSAVGRFLLWYDNDERNYFSYDGKEIKNITAGIQVPLYDELNDVPASPRQYGIMGWLQGDQAVYIYDRYDVWMIDPAGKKKPVRITPDGRSQGLVYRYVKTNPDEKYLATGQTMVFDVFNDRDKSAQIAEAKLSGALKFKIITSGDVKYSRPVKARDAQAFIYTKESYVASPDLYLFNGREQKLTALNPWQSEYNWGTAELFKWRAYDGKMSEGIVYKPENFDRSKKYPVILYFYERLSDNLNAYIAPEPTRSRLNISFFVSRGYIVFAPDIAYQDGHPGKSAYDYIVSGAKALAENAWVDANNIGIQGQSWGGYQVAHLITRTDMFKAAWAGAPVANMFSAYGGIRWESGMNRQFQYEKTQSRIGATIWERPDLYIENSPLFHLTAVKTPLVIMANDADGAVPWYQGIELFTALRRLGKPVWMLNYNGEAHNLVERKNKKDIQIREQQFFDWLLKGEKPPVWITQGVKAIDKGREWGLETAN